MAIPNKKVNYPYITHPFAALTINFFPERLKKIDPARLACLIHAANVHSEPESNPSIDWLISAEADVLPNRIPLPQSNGIEGSFCTLKIVSFPPVTQQKQTPLQGAFQQNRQCRSRSRAGRNRKRLTTKLSKIISDTAKAIPETVKDNSQYESVNLL